MKFILISIFIISLTMVFIYPFIELIIVKDKKLFVIKQFIIDNPNITDYPTYTTYKYAVEDPEGKFFTYIKVKPLISKFGIYINIKSVDISDLRKFTKDEVIDLKDSHNFGRSKKITNKFNL